MWAGAEPAARGQGRYRALSAPGDVEMAGRGGAGRAHWHDLEGGDVSRSRREACGAKSDDNKLTHMSLSQ